METNASHTVKGMRRTQCQRRFANEIKQVISRKKLEQRGNAVEGSFSWHVSAYGFVDRRVNRNGANYGSPDKGVPP